MLVVDREAVAQVAADLVVESLEAGGSTLGLATGSSPLGTYAELGRRCDDGRLSLAGCRGFLLDEYVGLPRVHPQSYGSVIRRELVAITDLPAEDVHGPDGTAPDLAAEAERYEAQVRAAGVDVQLLGIGSNGHIGFNEPGSALDSVTRTVRLTERTRRDNARFFDHPDDVPHEVLTQGLATISAARRLVLLALGERKAPALRDALEGPVTPACPASILQEHPDAYVVADPAAAGLLRP